MGGRKFVKKEIGIFEFGSEVESGVKREEGGGGKEVENLIIRFKKLD